MEVFGFIGMAFGVFGLIAWIQLQTVSKELGQIKKALKDSGILDEANAPKDK